MSIQTHQTANLPSSPVTDAQLSPRSKYTGLMYSTLDHPEVQANKNLISFFTEQINRATSRSGPLSIAEKKTEYQTKNLFNSNGSIRDFAVNLLLQAESSSHTAQIQPSDSDSSRSASNQTPLRDQAVGTIEDPPSSSHASENSASTEPVDQSWLTTEVESTLQDICIERVPRGAPHDGFYPYPKFFTQKHRLILHKTVNGKNEEYASFSYKNFMFEFILKEDGNIGIEPRNKSVINVSYYPAEDLPGILADFRRGKCPAEIKDLVAYGPGGKSVYAAVTNGILAAAGYVLEKTAKASDTVENYVPSAIASPVGEALAAYLISGTAGYFGFNMSYATVLTLFRATQDIGTLASKCADSDKKKTALDDFSEAYRNRDVEKKSNRIEFDYQKEKITIPSTFNSLINELQLKLNNDQQTSVATGCSLANELEKNRRLNKQITGNDHPGWEVIKSSDDIAGVYKYDEKSNELFIAFRSSIKSKEETYIEDLDARIHLTAVPHHPLAHGIDLDGKMHAGFLKKYEGCKGSFYQSLQNFFTSLDPEKLKDLHVIIAGHGMGAAVSQIAAADLCKNILPKIYEKEARTNRVWSVSVSSPCLGDDEAMNKMEELIGVNNCIRLNVPGDPMTIAGSSEMLRNTPSFISKARKLPAIKQLLDCLVFKPLGNSILLHPLQTTRYETNSELDGALQKIISNEYKEGVTTIFRHFLAPTIGGEFNKEAFESIRLERLIVHDSSPKE